MSQNYTIFSEKTLQYQEKLDEILKSLAPREYDLVKMDLSEDALISLVNELEAAPFLYDLRVVIMENPEFLYDKSADDRMVDQFTKFVNDPSETTVLITLIKDNDLLKLKKSDDLSKSQKDAYKALKDKTNQVTFSKPTPKDTDDVIDRELAGYEISARAREELKSRVDADMMRLYVELDKLKLYKNEEKTITEDDVVLMVSRDLEDKAYNLSSAIISKNRKEALLILSDFKKTGVKAVELLQVVMNKICEMYQLKILSSSGYDNDMIASYFGYKPGRIFYMIKDASKYSLGKIKDEMKKLLMLEYDIKRGRKDPDQEMELYILGI